LLLLSPAAWAGDELAAGKMVDGTSVPYVLTTGGGTPAYALILMPGGLGVLSPHLHSDGSVAFQNGDNFAVRVRSNFAEGPFVAATTDRTSTPDRILAIVADLQRRYPGVKIYVLGFSLSTESTMALAKPLDGRVAGFVHSSSMNGIASLDPRSLKSRHLIVVHKEDICPRSATSVGPWPTTATTASSARPSTRSSSGSSPAGDALGLRASRRELTSDSCQKQTSNCLRLMSA
jgi:hypothetical protein